MSHVLPHPPPPPPLPVLLSLSTPTRVICRPIPASSLRSTSRLSLSFPLYPPLSLVTRPSVATHVQAETDTGSPFDRQSFATLRADGRAAVSPAGPSNLFYAHHHPVQPVTRRRTRDDSRDTTNTTLGRSATRSYSFVIPSSVFFFYLFMICMLLYVRLIIHGH